MDRLKVLIAEDNKTCQAFYKEGLPDDSFDKKFADNGEEAVEIYESWEPDVIALDLEMPVKSGYAALKEIRKMEKGLERSTAIIIVSSISSREDIRDCAKLGIQGYVIKPFKTEEIAGIISEYYQKFRSSKDNPA